MGHDFNEFYGLAFRTAVEAAQFETKCTKLHVELLQKIWLEHPSVTLDPTNNDIVTTNLYSQELLVHLQQDAGFQL